MPFDHRAILSEPPEVFYDRGSEVQRRERLWCNNKLRFLSLSLFHVLGLRF